MPTTENFQARIIKRLQRFFSFFSGMAGYSDHLAPQNPKQKTIYLAEGGQTQNTVKRCLPP
jgi:hypothetical protein